jgi:hypothetical protein
MIGLKGHRTKYISALRRVYPAYPLNYRNLEEMMA